MRRRHKIIASVAAATIIGGGALYVANTVHVGSGSLYPNSQLTQGKWDTQDENALTATYTDNCPNGKTECTYSQDHRNVPAAEHQHVYDEYNVPQAERNIQYGEVDHFIPLCGGGSNDLSNLWYQPATNMWKGQNFGFHEKDALETWICVEEKAGRLDPKVADQKLLSDWVQYYLEVKPPAPSFGSVDSSN